MSGRPRSFDEEQVLERAMFAFWKHGFEATGMADLEQATGLGRQSLYGAFGDKRAVFLKVVEFYFAKVLTVGLIDVLDAPGSALANLERVFAQWQALAVSPDFHGCLVGNAASDMRAHDDEMKEVLRRKLRLLEDAFTRAIRRGQSLGEISTGVDARATARSLLTLAQGLAVLARVHKEPSFVRGVVECARKLLSA